MHTHSGDATILFDTIGAAERAKLVRLCAHLSGDTHAAEDLAQETLLVAWRQRHRLVDPAAVQPWLWAIARNVCRHWRRSRQREGAHLVQPQPAAEAPDQVYATAPDPFDLQVELERAELATLLDQALALLPPETRAVLVQKYIDESPHADIAAQLGLSENAVAVRLYRGKLAFKRILNTELQDVAAEYGLIQHPAVHLQPTRIWCPLCGQQRMIGTYDQQAGLLVLRCPRCCPATTSAIWETCAAPMFGGAKQVRAALDRGMAASYEFYRRMLAQRGVLCAGCGRALPLHRGLPQPMRPPYPTTHGLYTHCPTCDEGGSTSLRMLAQCSPQVRNFWRRHPQMRTLPERHIEVCGRPAILISFQSMRDPAQIDVLAARDSYELLLVHESSVIAPHIK